MLVRESIESIFKPREGGLEKLKEWIKNIAQEIMLDLLEEGVRFYWKSFQQYFTMKSSQEKKFMGTCKEDLLNKYNKKFGPGLYVIFQGSPLKKIPMENIYSNRMISTRTIQYDLPATELETAIQELVAQVIKGTIKTGFIIKYFDKNEKA